ncbi:MAG: sarcosine oxidase subunit gamma [Proteobacteria bacterium]|nr:MAG: sarcosine oxidase subunit gamma [Pseudomonadota bacterium]
MAKRESALTAHYQRGHFGAEETGVTLSEVKELRLQQIATWPETMAAVSAKAIEAAGCDDAPTPCQSCRGSHASLLRIEPLKWWLLGDAELPTLASDEGVVLDLSHSRTAIRIEGECAADLLNRHLPLDLREASFGDGAVALTAFHHVGVTLLRHQDGYDLFVPRGFAVSLWEMLLASAEQFGVEVV